VTGQAQPGGGRRVMGTGTCIALIAIGAILRFAVATTSSHGVNVHVVGIIVLLAGVLGLVLSLLVWGPMNPGRRRAGPPRGYDDSPPPVVVEQRRIYRDDPPPVAADQRPLYRDDPPL
jgi:hypothetical protein